MILASVAIIIINISIQIQGEKNRVHILEVLKERIEQADENLKPIDSIVDDEVLMMPWMWTED